MLYGIGCAPIGDVRWRLSAANKYLKPFTHIIQRYRTFWHSVCVHFYFRQGVTLNNAFAGVDGALWTLWESAPTYRL